ncbi:hypothetical protein [Roseibium aggregatum]|uniref:Transposase n=1 Tax=Roseibium aggregatum TaxID=187304 RepID=A0A926S8Q3_9HYPH|nr:hypothetical protein [Roseibium aggregatum]MBD1545319.1 hypothetical protein [Roseibium aggregatum]
MTEHETEIRRLPNGAIDTDFYIRKCHRERSERAHQAVGKLARFSGRCVGALRMAAKALASRSARSVWSGTARQLPQA